MFAIKPTGSVGGSSRRARMPHRLLLPRRRLDLHGQPVAPRGDQEIAPPRAFEEGPLTRAQVKCLLQFRGFARSLGAKKDDRRVGCDHRSLVRAQKVARVLSGKQQGTVVFANSAPEADQKASDGPIFAETAQPAANDP